MGSGRGVRDAGTAPQLCGTPKCSCTQPPGREQDEVCEATHRPHLANAHPQYFATRGRCPGCNTAPPQYFACRGMVPLTSCRGLHPIGMGPRCEHRSQSMLQRNRASATQNEKLAGGGYAFWVWAWCRRVVRFSRQTFAARPGQSLAHKGGKIPIFLGVHKVSGTGLVMALLHWR